MIERERQLSKIYYISKCFGKLTVECFKIELSNPFGEQNKKKTEIDGMKMKYSIDGIKRR